MLIMAPAGCSQVLECYRTLLQVPIITAHLPGSSLPSSTIDGIVAFFNAARELAPGLSDGSSAPAYNMRTLARSIQYVSHAASLHGMHRALYDGFAMCFAGMLEADSAGAIVDLLKQHVLHNKAEPSLPSVTRSLPKVLLDRSERFVNVEVRAYADSVNVAMLPKMRHT